MRYVVTHYKMSIKPYIFYHSHCQDGIIAAGVMMNYFEINKRYTRPHIIPYNHGDPIDVKALRISRGFTRRATSEEERNTWVGIEVYFLDILPSLEILKAVADTGCKIVILDHHKSAIKIIKDILAERKEIPSQDVDSDTGKLIKSKVEVPKYQNIVSGFDLDYSGCGLAWKFAKDALQAHSSAQPRAERWDAILVPKREHSPSPSALFNEEYNPLVEFVQDRDIWRHSYKESNWVLSYLATTKRAINPTLYAKELRLWGDMSGELTPIRSVDGSRTLYVNDFVVDCIKQGREVFEAYHEECVKIAQSYVVKTLCHPKRDFRVAITECSGKYASAVGDILAKLPGVDFSVSYENVTETNGGNSQCRGIVMNLDNTDPYIYLRARARGNDDVDLSEIIRYWDAEGSTGGGHAKAAGSTSTMQKFISSFC